MDCVRLDRWLCAARIFRSRTLAARACAGGRVRVNGSRAKPHHPVRIGDRIDVETPRASRVLEARALADRRLPAAGACELYADRSPPPEVREEPFLPRGRGAGRPTKRDLRALRRLRGRS